jgi:hypothetical protein
MLRLIKIRGGTVAFSCCQILGDYQRPRYASALQHSLDPDEGGDQNPEEDEEPDNAAIVPSVFGTAPLQRQEQAHNGRNKTERSPGEFQAILVINVQVNGDRTKGNTMDRTARLFALGSAVPPAACGLRSWAT